MGRRGKEVEVEREKEREKEKVRMKAVKESRRTSEGRRRTPLTEVFPAEQVATPPRGYPVVTVEEPTLDGHSAPDDREYLDGERGSVLETPVKVARRRPVSEQLLGRSRPKGMYEEDGDGVFPFFFRNAETC